MTELSRPALISLFVAGLIGLAVRALYFQADTSFWGDETALAANLSERTFSGLTETLAKNQAAPYGFLVLEKVLYLAFGRSEYVLRAPAFAASIVALPLLAALLVRAAVSARTAVLALSLLALCPMAVRYGAELKPYSLDLAASIVILLMAVSAIRAQFSGRSLVTLLVVGVILPWFSYPSVFVLAGVGATLIVERARTGQLRQAAIIALAAVAWLTSFVVMYWLVARNALATDALATFWDYAFVSLPPTSLWDIRHAAGRALAIFRDPVGLAGVELGAVLFIVGLVAMGARDRRLPALCLLPILAAYIASAAHAYPFATRLLLFLVPLAVWPIAEGAVALAAPLRHRALHLVLATALLAGQVVAVSDLLEQPERSGVRDALRRIAPEIEPGDALYVYYHAAEQFTWYRAELGSQPADVVMGARDIRAPGRVHDDLARLSGRTRVWFLFSEVQTFFGNEEQLILSKVEPHARQLGKIVVGPANAYLYASPSGNWTE